MTVSNEAIQGSAEATMRHAGKTAFQWLAKHGHSKPSTDADWKRFGECLQSALKAHLETAFRDAHEAHSVGMGDQIATATYFAEITLAGIDCAKQFVGVN
jgi:hypothetical protein